MCVCGGGVIVISDMNFSVITCFTGHSFVLELCALDLGEVRVWHCNVATLYMPGSISP